MKLNASSETDQAFTAIRRGDDVVMITGRAGTGKSTLIRRLLEEDGENQVVLAPTGVAAINVGGQTIHSFFSIRRACIIIPRFSRVAVAPTSSKN